METETPQIPGYRIEKIIGKGAMSTVYLAVQESLDRRVALKVLTPKLAADPTFNKRFVKEGRIIAKLAHPHIVTIHDTGSHQDHSYIAMEYLEAGTLRERIKAGLTPEQASNYLCQIAQALGYAHRQNCVHRDIKPANILFRDGETAVLSDFGIAKNLEDKTQLTAAGWRVGTPNYMSPEQTLGKPVDARSDLYSLGILFHEMLTGTRPYQGADAFATALLHVKAPLPVLPAPLRRFQPVLDRLLAKDPQSRFASAEELVQAVQKVAAGGTLAGARAGRPGWWWVSSWILAVLLAGAAALLAYRFLPVTPAIAPPPVSTVPR
ncbi:MAG: serine/threonine-protein kinase [Candidatus Competibacter sp.]|nr:serine/threonine-protein kinase [Candidatus Competibacter sp.]